MKLDPETAHRRHAVLPHRLCGPAAAPAAVALAGGSRRAGPDRSSFHFPTVPPEHRHVRALLENAMRYAAPENRMVDPISGYPFEGWNQDPKRGLFLRSFTQLTAIGQWMELLANVVAGQADTPYLSRDQALDQLTHLVQSLRQDQHDPRLSAQGLLGNFLDLATGKRLGPLASDVEKQKFLDAFGADQGRGDLEGAPGEGLDRFPQPGPRGRDPARSPKYG